MKTVTGEITDSTPVTIAKAASILSKFVSTDTGASQALNAYLRRTAAAFDELARLHSKFDRRKHKRDSAQIQRVEASQSGLVNNNEQRLKKEVNVEGNAAEEETERKRRRRRRKGDLEEETERSNEVKKEKTEFEENEGKVVGRVDIKVEEEMKKKKKKRKSGEVEVELKVKEEEREGKDRLKDEGQRKTKKRRKHEDEN
ncbi:PREDICTED: protein PXR1-like [Populus euphratica]|uniref:Protein PXR1-like n=1 Tax=Populus euphratica TaxID=75702 RepID=A0AAJ6UXG2_POPEU|nr:PREDICTED: protein PXR1-like [Populus euphratica]XP_011037393.1 PREDICTED: protein PXR1-like [Populus euphratica]